MCDMPAILGLASTLVSLSDLFVLLVCSSPLQFMSSLLWHFCEFLIVPGCASLSLLPPLRWQFCGFWVATIMIMDLSGCAHCVGLRSSLARISLSN